MEKIHTIDEQSRRDEIIDYIGKHQGCTAEDVVRGVNLSGRGKTFRILKDLKKEKIIREEKSDTNRKNKKLLLIESNPLVSLPKEIKEFKKHLYGLFKNAQYYRSIYKNEAYPDDVLLGRCFSLFFEYFNINNYRAFVIWPNTIKDKETLGKLYMLFYSEMIKLNLELREKFQPVEFGVLMKKRKIIAKGMDREEYLTIAKNAAEGALAVAPGTLHFEKIQRTFYEHKLEDVSRPVVDFMMKFGEEIYDSQATQSELDSMRKFREECAENEKIGLERQKELEQLAKKLRTIDRKRKRNRNSPYPYCNYDYGSLVETFDQATWKRGLSWFPNTTPWFPNTTPE